VSQSDAGRRLTAGANHTSHIGAALKADPALSRRIVVVSPHLDDGVLSLGAAMSRWARKGARVELVTVFAGDPDSTAPAGGWDARAGHATEGESARARREEDRRACAHLGATPIWLPFGSVDYERHGTPEDVLSALAEVVAGPDELLVPGIPLTHPDHAWLARLLDGESFSAKRRSVYHETLYARREGRRREVGYGTVRSTPRDRLAKWRALHEYESQLPLLGLTTRRRRLSIVLEPEAVAWTSH
jgi:LmbE family N-acetylglucosaminyl deacetylase